MTDQNQIPSRDPANDDSMTGLFRQVLDKHLQNTDDMLPAQVIAFNRQNNTVQVKPMIKVLTTSGQTVSRAQIIGLPVMQIGGGGMVLAFNLKPGDLGWIKANDRDISLFLQSWSEAAPNTLRKHSFSDAVFIPDVMHGWTIAGEDAESAVLQTLDGTMRIALWPDKIKLTAGSKTLTLSDSGAALVGNLSVTGTITATGQITGAGIALSTHTHSGVSTGPSNTGAPNP